MLTQTHSAVGFGGHETHLGVARVPDLRVDRCVEMFHPKKHAYATIEYLDVPAVTKETLRDASYLAGLREVDALAHVVRLFGDDVDARRDIRNVEEELLLSDMAQIEKRMERLERDLKKIKNAELQLEYDVLKKAAAGLEAGRPLRELTLDPNDKKRIRGFMFLSEKPMLFVLNVPEERAGHMSAIEAEYQDLLTGRPQTALLTICASIEVDIAELPAEEAAVFMESYGLKESGLERLVRATYGLMGLMSFFTVGEDEVRAWTVSRTATAQEAAGAIHSDLAKHFIRAEVVSCDDLLRLGSLAACRDNGVLRLEGKDAPVHDGDIVHIRHSG
jgi:GTP-binding protein YchF